MCAPVSFSLFSARSRFVAKIRKSKVWGIGVAMNHINHYNWHVITTREREAGADIFIAVLLAFMIHSYLLWPNKKKGSQWLCLKPLSFQHKEQNDNEKSSLLFFFQFFSFMKDGDDFFNLNARRKKNIPRGLRTTTTAAARGWKGWRSSLGRKLSNFVHRRRISFSTFFLFYVQISVGDLDNISYLSFTCPGSDEWFLKIRRKT